MITGVCGTTVWSEDLNRLLPFYRDLLGFPVAIDTPGLSCSADRMHMRSRWAPTVTCMA
jgi:hypothetical protein